jgi:hypothetical protein
MTTKTPQKFHDQVKAFRKAARQLGCDQDEGRFQDALRKVAKHKPSERPEGKKARANNRRD